MAYPLITPGDVVEVVINQQLYGQTCLNVLHFGAEAAFQQINQNDVFDALFAEMTGPLELLPLMQACQSKDVSYTGITFQVIKAQRYARVPRLFTGMGTRGAPAGTANVAATISKSTGLATEHQFATGRGQLGSFHIAGPPQDTYENGLFKDNFLNTSLNSVAEWFTSNFTSPTLNGFVLCLYHRKVDGANRFDAVTQTVARNTVRVSRRRTVGLGI